MLAVVFAVLLAVAPTRTLAAWYNPAKDLRHAQPHHTSSAASSCHEPAYVFTKYIASSWEQEWLKNADDYSQDICGKQRDQADKSRSWLKAISAYRTGDEYHTKDFDPNVWSHFEYRRGCANHRGGQKLFIPIEPAVGHLRHPFWDAPLASPSSCVPTGELGVNIESRDSVLPSALPPQTFYSMYSGRSYLFDLGTGPNFNSSLRWFVDNYAARGVTFDQIWTWEVTPVADHEAFWLEVPSNLRSRVHFHNTALTAKEGDANNPVNLIKSIYQPGDFIVLKLDIEGNEEVEGALIQALLKDEAFRGMMGEMYYELHFGRDIFGLADISLADALQTFKQLREQGVRLHFWP